MAHILKSQEERVFLLPDACAVYIVLHRFHMILSWGRFHCMLPAAQAANVLCVCAPIVQDI